MAAGDAVIAWESKAANATLDIQPAGTAQWQIQVIKSEQGKPVEVYQLDDAAGTNKKLDNMVEGGSVQVTHRVTNAKWIQLKNVAADARFIGYEAVETK